MKKKITLGFCGRNQGDANLWVAGLHKYITAALYGSLLTSRVKSYGNDQSKMTHRILPSSVFLSPFSFFDQCIHISHTIQRLFTAVMYSFNQTRAAQNLRVVETLLCQVLVVLRSLSLYVFTVL